MLTRAVVGALPPDECLQGACWASAIARETAATAGWAAIMQRRGIFLLSKLRGLEVVGPAGVALDSAAGGLDDNYPGIEACDDDVNEQNCESARQTKYWMSISFQNLK